MVFYYMLIFERSITTSSYMMSVETTASYGEALTSLTHIALWRDKDAPALAYMVCPYYSTIHRHFEERCRRQIVRSTSYFSALQHATEQDYLASPVGWLSNHSATGDGSVRAVQYEMEDSGQDLCTSFVSGAVRVRNVAILVRRASGHDSEGQVHT